MAILNNCTLRVGAKAVAAAYYRGANLIGGVFAPPSETYGTRRLRASYAGPLLRVRRSSDNTEQDIGYSFDGSLNTTSLLAFIGAGNGFVVTFYDQYGAGNNLVTSTASQQPRIVANGIVEFVGDQIIPVWPSVTLFGLFAAAGFGAAGRVVNVVAESQYKFAMDCSVKTRAVVSNDGLASGTNALSQYINRVNGTDVVSDAKYKQGFAVTGKANSGAAATIRFYLQNDRTGGVDQLGTQLQHGVDGVMIAYDNATGSFTVTFGPSSNALKQAAVHNTYGAGVHKIGVDTDGNGSLDARRLFLVADGTAGATSYDKAGNAVAAGSVAANFSVQDKVTGDVFVYYYGDLDANGIGLWTQLDSGDSASNVDVVTTDRDADDNGFGDWDYYNTTGVALGTPSTTGNTALGFVTNIQAQVWEFHMGKASASSFSYDTAISNAGDHTLWNSNTSRLGSLEEMLALYAANFGADTGGGGAAANIVGAVQPITDTSSFNDYVATEDNRPGGWTHVTWSSAPTPSGHANLYLYNGYATDTPDGYTGYVSAVL